MDYAGQTESLKRNGYRRIASAAHAHQLLRGEIKRLRRKQQRIGKGPQDYELAGLLDIVPGNWFCYVRSAIPRRFKPRPAYACVYPAPKYRRKNYFVVRKLKDKSVLEPQHLGPPIEPPVAKPLTRMERLDNLAKWLAKYVPGRNWLKQRNHEKTEKQDESNT